ncbi:MAG: type II secretion system F family protein [Micropruina sp.]|nr:MAG: type II secretion system F family protein [Micropruina sp.]
MTGLLAGLAGGLLAGGLLLGVWGLIPQPVRPAAPKPARRPGWWSRLARWQQVGTLLAVPAGVVVGLLTGWVVAIVVLPAAVLGLPAILMVSDESKVIARLEGIAEWTRNLAGVMTAGQGIEQAIQASLRSTPEPIRGEVGRLVARLRARWSTDAALRAFADDLADPTGDMVCAALLLGATRRGDGLARVLTGLSESVAEDVKARRQIEADRAKPRSTARTVTLLSLGALAFPAFTGTFLAPYGSALGQVILSVMLAGYAACLVWLRRLSIIAPPPRFLGREARS